jgi:hypothetical protein
MCASLYKLTDASVLNKSSCKAAALGVTNFTNVRDVILATLCCATYVRLECLTNPPKGEEDTKKLL